MEARGGPQARAALDSCTAVRRNAAFYYVRCERGTDHHFICRRCGQKPHSLGVRETMAKRTSEDMRREVFEEMRKELGESLKRARRKPPAEDLEAIGHIHAGAPSH